MTSTITFRRVPRTAALEAGIAQHLEKLRTFAPAILSARVIVEPAVRHRRAGNPYHVRIDLSVPGENIVVSHEASLRPAARAAAAQATRKQDETQPAHKYLEIAIADAFAAARRRLQDRVRRRRGSVKAHEATPVGRVVRMFRSDAYGFLEAPDGHEVYFRDRSVLEGKFGRLRVGSRVAFIEERGEKGPQASTVRLVR
jgi:cold shock CspA family protein